MTANEQPVPTSATDIELAGDILRVVKSGLPKIVCNNAEEALSELRSKHEAFRNFLNAPPNGNRLTNSSLLYPPFEQGTDGALFLASRFAYAPYAGTALMAAATVLGLAQNHRNQSLFTLETASGVMNVELFRKGNIITHAKWYVDPPRLLINKAGLLSAAGTIVSVSLVDAGLPYLVADVDKMGISLDERAKLPEMAIQLSTIASRQFPMARFGIGNNYGKYLVMFYCKVADNHLKAIWVSDQGEIANSAGGTGALSVLAACEGNGLLTPGQTTLIEAPGGFFESQIADGRATVKAGVRIAAEQVSLPEPT